jgi:hypothetical protein
MVFGITLFKQKICPCWEKLGEDGICRLSGDDESARIKGANEPCTTPKGCPTLIALARMSDYDIQNSKILHNKEYILQAIKFYRTFYRS